MSTDPRTEHPARTGAASAHALAGRIRQGGILIASGPAVHTPAAPAVIPDYDTPTPPPPPAPAPSRTARAGARAVKLARAVAAALTSPAAAVVVAVSLALAAGVALVVVLGSLTITAHTPTAAPPAPAAECVLFCGTTDSATEDHAQAQAVPERADTERACVMFCDNDTRTVAYFDMSAASPLTITL